MTEQFNSLEEKAKRIDIALKYTDGNMERAKEMVSGHYFDIKVLKGKFITEADGSSGVFLGFFNIITEFIPSVTSSLSSNPRLFEQVRIFDDWTTLLKDMKKFSKSEESHENALLGITLLRGPPAA